MWDVTVTYADGSTLHFTIAYLSGIVGRLEADRRNNAVKLVIVRK